MYESESETGHRNRAIGHMLRNFDILTEPPDPVVNSERGQPMAPDRAVPVELQMG